MGRDLSPSRYPWNSEKVQKVGFLLYDKQAGDFQIEVDWIKTYWKAIPFYRNQKLQIRSTLASQLQDFAVQSFQLKLPSQTLNPSKIWACMNKEFLNIN